MDGLRRLREPVQGNRLRISPRRNGIVRCIFEEQLVETPCCASPSCISSCPWIPESDCKGAGYGWLVLPLEKLHLASWQTINGCPCKRPSYHSKAGSLRLYLLPPSRHYYRPTHSTSRVVKPENMSLSSALIPLSYRDLCGIGREDLKPKSVTR